MKTLQELINDPETTKEQLVEAIQNLPINIQSLDLDSQFAIVWCTEDLDEYIPDGIELTEEQKKEILDNVEGYGCEVSWEVIRCAVEQYLDDNDLWTEEDEDEDCDDEDESEEDDSESV